MDILQSDIEQDDTIKEATQAEEDPGRNSPQAPITESASKRQSTQK